MATTAPAPTTFPPAPSKPSRSPKSKPILNWLQRKLTSAGRRASVSASSRPGLPTASGGGSKYSTLTSNGATNSNGTPLHNIAPSRRTAASPAPTSDWTPTEPAQADDDASTRPLPPTSPPSPAPSRHTYSASHSSSSVYRSSSLGGTHQSTSISTKPTTLLSIDSSVRPAPPPHAPSIHFSALPPSSPDPTTPTTPTQPTSPSQIPSSSTASPDASLPAPPPHPWPERGIPNHSLPNPSRNPRPSSPPLDNSSILTLASSTAAGRRGGGTSLYPEEEEGSYGYGRDASVRALKPRSRRGSWGTSGTGLVGEEYSYTDEVHDGDQRMEGDSEPVTPTPSTPMLEPETEVEAEGDVEPEQEVEKVETGHDTEVNAKLEK